MKKKILFKFCQFNFIINIIFKIIIKIIIFFEIIQKK
jgi:hypothetical protein